MRINTPAVNHQTIEGEVVAINLATGVYYSLLGVGACIWERIDAGRSAAEIEAELMLAYPDAAVHEGCAPFFADLTGEGLVVEEDAPAREIPLSPLPPAFEPPLLEKFTDMQELLLLDPIHEVDEAGWPAKASNS